MPWTGSGTTLQQRRFTVVAGAAIALILAGVVLLSPWLPPDARASVSGLGLMVAGALATVSGGIKAHTEQHDRERRAWLVLTGAGLILICGNAWVAASDADPLLDPSTFSNATIAVALILSVVALTMMPHTRHRGSELILMLLDGAIAGGAFLLIAAVLVYARLLDAPRGTSGIDRAFALAFPALDVLLATMAVLLIVRSSRAERLKLCLVGAAFLSYAASDIAFAVGTAQGTFHFGSEMDLGWFAGYIMLGLAAWTPTRPSSSALRSHIVLSDVLGTVLVFATVVAATIVQFILGDTRGSLSHARTVLWVLIFVTAGVRQTLLTFDNASLRKGLQQRVDEQTAHLIALARQNEVLLTSVGDGVYGVDQDGVITFINPNGADILGWRVDQLVGREAHVLLHESSDSEATQHAWSDCYIQHAITRRLQTHSEDDVYTVQNGADLPVEITASPLVDDASSAGAVVVFRDATKRRELDRMKNEFMAVVSHELRTPLTSVHGSLALLSGGQLGQLPKQAASMLDVALRSTERLTRLINGLLSIERLASTSQPLDRRAVPAWVLLTAAVEQATETARSIGISLEMGSADGTVFADEAHIVQALLNLIGNAIKFSEPGSTVHVDSRKEGHEVRFRVSDHGRGIPPDKLEAIFDRFEQVHASDAQQRGGTGLGLTISRGIIARHAGRIWAESTLGVGTTFHFTLPAKRTTIASGPGRAAASASTRPPARPPAPVGASPGV